MNEAQRIMFSFALGDGYIQKRNRLNRGKYKYVSTELRIAHSMKQEGYLSWKRDLLSHALNRPISIKYYKNVGPERKHQQCMLSISSPLLQEVHTLLYPDNKKKFSSDALAHLDRQSLAIFFMDDGHLRKNIDKNGLVSSLCVELSTCCSETEAADFISCLQRHTGSKFSAFKDMRLSVGHEFSLRSSTQADAIAFITAVLDYIPEPMRYKIAPYFDHLSGAQTQARGSCSSCGIALYENRTKGLCRKCWYADRTDADMRERKASRQFEANQRYISSIEKSLRLIGVLSFRKHFVNFRSQQDTFIIKAYSNGGAARIERVAEEGLRRIAREPETNSMISWERLPVQRRSGKISCSAVAVEPMRFLAFIESRYGAK